MHRRIVVFDLKPVAIIVEIDVVLAQPCTKFVELFLSQRCQRGTTFFCQCVGILVECGAGSVSRQDMDLLQHFFGRSEGRRRKKKHE